MSQWVEGNFTDRCDFCNCTYIVLYSLVTSPCLFLWPHMCITFSNHIYIYFIYWGRASLTGVCGHLHSSVVGHSSAMHHQCVRLGRTERWGYAILDHWLVVTSHGLLDTGREHSLMSEREPMLLHGSKLFILIKTGVISKMALWERSIPEDEQWSIGLWSICWTARLQTVWPPKDPAWRQCLTCGH